MTSAECLARVLCGTPDYVPRPYPRAQRIECAISPPKPDVGLAQIGPKAAKGAGVRRLWINLSD